MNKIIKKSYLSKIVILFLMILSAIVFWRWLNFSPFVFADWGFGFKNVFLDFIHPSTGGMFGFNILLWRYGFYLLYGLIANLGFDSNVIEKILVFWPIIFITPLSSFLLTKRITHSNMAGVIGSLIFTYNTYFLSINTQGHVLLPLAYAVALFAIHACINLFESKKIYYVPLTALLLFIVGSIDLRSLYVTSLIIIGYAVYYQLVQEKNWKDNLLWNILSIGFVFVILSLLNLYWLLPAITVQKLSQGDLFYTQLFGSNFYNIQNTLALFYPFWSGKEPTWHFLQKIPIEFWLYPILAFIGLIVGRKNKTILFFGILSLIGIFLSKQEAPPFSSIYPWLFQHIPGFAAFREASKFNFIIVLSYSILISSSVYYFNNFMKDRKVLKIILISLIALLPLWNAVPLITGEINTLFVPKEIPDDFKRINKFLSVDSSYRRVFVLNNNIFWSFSSEKHPVTEAEHSIRYYWKDTNLYDFKSTITTGKNIISLLSKDETRRLLSSASVGYIVVNIEEKQTNSYIRRDMGESRSFFEQSLDNLSFLKKVDIGLQNALLYQNTQVKPIVYITDENESLKKDISYRTVDVIQVTPTQIRFGLRNIKSPVYVQFTGLYHPDWQLKIGTFSWPNAIGDSHYFYPEKYHTKNAMVENTYLIDPSYIKDHINKKLYTINNDGSINIEATLFFRPQAYLYLGLIIGGITLVLSLGTIGFLLMRDRKNIFK